MGIFGRILALWTIAAAACGSGAAAPAPILGGDAYAADAGWLIDQIGAHYAYLPERHIDLAKLRAIYVAKAHAAADDHAFLGVIEHLTGELHDHHATLSTNNAASPQLVPTGAEIWAHFDGAHAVVDEVRPGSDAETAGLRAGDEITALNGAAIVKAVAAAMPQTLTAPDAEAADYVLRVLLAGNHETPRAIDFTARDGKAHHIVLAPFQGPTSAGLLTARWESPGIAYIRIENSLGDSDLVAAFDDALAKFKSANALILDLRNTPSGGNTDIAEPILARFIAKAAGYQRVFDPGPGKSFPKDSWVKEIAPRGPFTFTAPMVVLADHWTASMGEGMTIGLDAMDRATVVGTAMARLCGGTDEFVMPASKIGVHFPVERLYHVNGTPREAFLPPITVDLSRAPAGDAILAAGLVKLRAMVNAAP